MPQYDLAGNPLPEPGPPPAPPAGTAPPVAGPVALAPQRVLRAAPAPGPAPPARAPLLAPQAVLTRGITRETPVQRARAYAGLGGAFLLLILLTYAVAAIPAPVIPAPTSYTSYTSPNAAITCDVPGGWTQHDTLEGLSLHDGQARIEMDPPTPDLFGSSASLGDLHTQEQSLLSDAFSDDHFVERPPQVLRSNMAGALVSEWSAAPGLAHLRGFRATLATGSNAVVVICECPARDWKNLQPAFLHVIQSIAPAGLAAGSQGGGN